MIVFVVAMVVIFALLVFMWVSIGREPGPGPADVAIAYEHALGPSRLRLAVRSLG